MKTKIKSLLLAVIFTVISCITLTANATANIPDANGDGSISISDVVTISMYLAGQHSPTNPDAYDIDRNGIISAKDAMCVQKYLAQTWAGNGIGSSGSSEISNTSRIYNVYNAANGNYLRNYTLSPLASKSNNTRGIVGPEDRVVDWSKNGVVNITANGVFLGTGFIVGDHLIATAAHCVYNGSTNLIYSNTDVKVYNNDGTLAKVANGVEIHILKRYVDNSLNSIYHGSDDYAVITVEDDLSEFPHFGIGSVLDSATDNNLPVMLTGFPSSVNNVSTDCETMYTGTGFLINEYYTSDSQICSTCDTSGGNSGSPLYIEEEIGDNKYITAIGIFTSGPDTYSVSTRMTTDLIHFFKNNPNLNW